MAATPEYVLFSASSDVFLAIANGQRILLIPGPWPKLLKGVNRILILGLRRAKCHFSNRTNYFTEFFSNSYIKIFVNSVYRNFEHLFLSSCSNSSIIVLQCYCKISYESILYKFIAKYVLRQTYNFCI